MIGLKFLNIRLNKSKLLDECIKYIKFKIFS